MIDFEEYTRLEAKNSRSSEDRYLLAKYKLIEAYRLKDASLLTPGWIEKFSSPREMAVYKNLAELNDDPDLSILRQNERLGLRFGQERHDAIGVIQTLDNSRYIKLKFAKEILETCGFDSPFESREVVAGELKKRVDRYWLQDSRENKVRDICTKLKIRCPTYAVWDYKNKKNLMNNILKTKSLASTLWELTIRATVIGSNIQLMLAKTKTAFFRIIPEVLFKKPVDLHVSFCSLPSIF